jgi:hypothetical protein
VQPAYALAQQFIQMVKHHTAASFDEPIAPHDSMDSLVRYLWTPRYAVVLPGEPIMLQTKLGNTNASRKKCLLNAYFHPLLPSKSRTHL